ncbi:AsmA family protein [Microvirgula curvata]|uniref:AsmA family protein n=1 Tax=Microvirgula sp. AG722 TaxID=2183901 RepID=UPI000DC42985|nr:AsmA family protein [Microvirgula sp. AG722]RAS14892.1 AsmA protein [Microvirgula sp. AG722]
MNFNSGRFWLKTAVYALLTTVIAGLAVFLLLLWQFDSDAARRELEHAFAAQGRTLKVSGPVSPLFWPRPGIAVDNVSLSEADGHSDFAAMRRIELRFAWLPLLQKHYLVRQVRLLGVDATVIRRPDGTMNIADLFDARQQNERVHVKLDDLSIADGDISWRDEISGRKGRLTALRLDAGNMEDSGEIEVSTQLAWDGRQFDLHGKLPVSIADDQVRVDGFALDARTHLPRMQVLSAQLTGSLMLNQARGLLEASQLELKLETAKPAATAVIRAPKLDLSADGIFAPSVRFALNLGDQETHYLLDGQASNVRSANGRSQAQNIAGNFQWENGKNRLKVEYSAPAVMDGLSSLRLQPAGVRAALSTPYLPRGVIRTELTGQIDADLQAETLQSRLSGLFDGARLDLDIRQKSFTRPHHDVSLTLARLDLNRYLPAQDGPLAPLLRSSQKINLDWLSDVDLNGRVAIGQFDVGRFSVQQVDMDVRASSTGVDINRFTAQIYQGVLAGTLSISNDATPSLHIDQKLSHMNVHPLLKDLFDFSRIEGRGNGAADLTASGRTFDELRSTLGGTLSVSLSEGALTGINLVEALKNLPAELSQWGTQTIASDLKQKTPFQRLSASFAFDKGVGRNHDLKLASPLIDLNGQGKLDLSQNIVDYAFNVRANPVEFPKLKGLNVPIKITGALPAPTYALDFNALVKDKKTDAEKQQVLKDQLTRPLQVLK